MQKKPIDQQIYEARCKARGVEPAPFGRLDLEEVNEERREAREQEKARTGEAMTGAYGGTRAGAAR